MGRSLRALSLVALLLLGAAATFLVPTLWGKPWSIDHFFLRCLVEFGIEHPMLLSYARVLEPYGLDFHSDDLEDFSSDAERRLQDQVDRFLKELKDYREDSLSESQQLSRDVLRWFLEAWQGRRSFPLHGYQVEQHAGLQSTLPDFMINIHRVTNEREARSYVVRLGKFRPALEQLAAGLRERREAGIVPPRFVIRKVREEVQRFVATPVSEGPLASNLAEKLSEVGELAEWERSEILDDARRAIEQSVYPGYRELDEALAEFEAVADENDGVWKHPNGDAYYRWALRLHTTTDLSPEEVHDIGLAQVARLRGEIQEVLRELGEPAADPGGTIRALHRDPRFLYPEREGVREQILADFQEIADDATARLPEFFGRLPRSPLRVERVPVFKEAGAAGAYYNPPAFDGSRPGIFYANLRSIEAISRFGMRTLTFHEGVPGHHLQIALAFENRELPLFRRLIPFTAFIEGWALYAETLAVEQGLLPAPADRLGYLVAQMFRAARLVVDTGIHDRRWTREQAIDYMLAETGMPRTDVEAEVERYIVTPGQACAYMIGQLEILELRERAREALGNRFDLRAFHDRVLGEGSLPLTVLERVVDRWIEAEQN